MWNFYEENKFDVGMWKHFCHYLSEYFVDALTQLQCCTYPAEYERPKENKVDSVINFDGYNTGKGISYQ